MQSGTPLTDADRKPWLDALKRRIDEAYAGVKTRYSRVRHSSTPIRITWNATNRSLWNTFT